MSHIDLNAVRVVLKKSSKPSKFDANWGGLADYLLRKSYLKLITKGQTKYYVLSQKGKKLGGEFEKLK